MWKVHRLVQTERLIVRITNQECGIHERKRRKITMEWESNCLSYLFAAGFVLVLQEQEGSGPLAVRSGINQPRHIKCGSCNGQITIADP